MSSEILSQYDFIIFDCDGVLMDTNQLKCEAFGMAVEGYPSKIVENFVSHCKNTFGISRYIKFKEFFSHFANEPFNEEKYNVFLGKYANICKRGYTIADITPGCERLLSKLNSSNINLYVASGSDEKELNEVLERRKLNKYFNQIYGSPKTKSECTKIILDKNPNKKGIFIGDALSDFKAANENNLDFIYASKYSVQSKVNDYLCRNNAVKVIDTLDDLI